MNNYILIYIISYLFIVLSACKKAPTDTRPPRLSFIPNSTPKNASLHLRDSVRIRLSIQSPDVLVKLKSLAIQIKYNNQPAFTWKVVDLSGLTQAFFRYDTLARLTPGTETWIFTAQTEHGTSVTDSLRYTVSPKPEEVVFQTFSLGFNNENAFGSWLMNRTFTAKDASQYADSIDLFYRWESNARVYWVSPSALQDSVLYPNVAFRNFPAAVEWRTTTLTKAQFDTLYYNDALTIHTAYDFGTPTDRNGTRLQMVDTNAVFAFRSRNRTGLMRANRIAQSESDRTNLTLKILK
jgi:hypothetical protein